ncbi:MAG: hypothetical protein IPJ41_06560 [Phycisphaerales bacterium]|nr:hypothetical protein [Phycisphaerales bacterium]
MLRATLAVITGYALWTILWLGGGAGIFVAFPAAFPEGGPYVEPRPLLAFLALSLLCSLAAGAVCRAIARAHRPVTITAVLLFLTGIGVQAAAWSSYPLWFQLAFLIPLVPVTLLGARLVQRKANAA